MVCKMSIYIKLKDDQFEFNGITHNRVAARAIVLNEDDKIGLLRVYGNDAFGFRDYLETPGGGVKENESLENAVKREVLEELGVSANILEKIGIVEDDYNLIFRHNIVHYYLMKVIEYKKRNLEEYEKSMIEEIRWFDIDEAIMAYENLGDSGIECLIKRRELPVLKHIKQTYFERK
jgi:8-oxo-dGTP pyrophosphatase MutT (NUDIX family)